MIRACLPENCDFVENNIFYGGAWWFSEFLLSTLLVLLVGMTGVKFVSLDLKREAIISQRNSFNTGNWNMQDDT